MAGLVLLHLAYSVASLGLRISRCVFSGATAVVFVGMVTFAAPRGTRSALDTPARNLCCFVYDLEDWFVGIRSARKMPVKSPLR